MKPLRKALRELLENLDPDSDTHRQISDALASDDEAIMRKALDQFDVFETRIIQGLRRTPRDDE